MDKSEPSLAPEWLRSSGSGSGGACRNFATSQSDGPLLAQPKRNKSTTSIGNSDGLHSSLDRSSSSNTRRTSGSNGLAKNERSQFARSYRNFSRGQRDRDRDRDRDRVTIDDNWDADYSGPLRSMMARRMERDSLRRSQSMVSRKQSEVLPRRDFADLRHARQNNHENGNGQRRSAGNTEKVAFERDFPLLKSDERPLTPDISRIPSPGLSSNMQDLSIGNSALMGGDGWTSALAEVPLGVGSSAIASTLNQPAPAAASSTTTGLNMAAASSATTGLNMAETLVQAPSRSHASQQPSVQIQKRDELAVLQSMRLIPMTPSTPKSMALNPSDKLKAKAAPRSGDQFAQSKNGHQLPSLQLGTQPARGANAKTESTKVSHTGKMLVLKPGRENGIPLSLKDTSNPAPSVTSKVVNGHQAGPTLRDPVSLKNPGNSKLSAFVPSAGSKDDKKPSLAHAQSRSDFFNLMRKKSLSNSSAHADSSHVVSSVGEKSAELENGTSAPLSSIKNDDEVKCNGDACEVSLRLDETSANHFGDNAAIPDEKEVAFLRSLGWDENAEDDEGLTEEEINAFYQEYMKLKPASKLCRDFQSKMLAQAEAPAACSGGPSSDFGVSDSSA